MLRSLKFQFARIQCTISIGFADVHDGCWCREARNPAVDCCLHLEHAHARLVLGTRFHGQVKFLLEITNNVRLVGDPEGFARGQAPPGSLQFPGYLLMSAFELGHGVLGVGVRLPDRLLQPGLERLRRRMHPPLALKLGTLHSLLLLDIRFTFCFLDKALRSKQDFIFVNPLFQCVPG